MTTFLDLIQNPDFRKYAMRRLAANLENSDYVFPSKFPLLFRYRSLSSYAIDDIINEQVTATSIGEFNDLFDGAIHRYGNDAEREAAAESRWTKLENLRVAAKLPKAILTHDYYTALSKKHFKDDSRLKFRLLDYLGTYVCCFSAKSDSTLMWSHYANSNKGICISYDFNQWKQGVPQRNLLFPIAYSNTPIGISDLLDDEQKKLCEYPIDTAVLCAALNKAVEWNYENEWRLLLILESGHDSTQRIPIRIFVKPSAIYFGYHFLKNCFYYDSGSEAERETCEKNIENINRLLKYLDINQISVFLMLPDVGSYTQKPKPIDIKKLRSFMARHFRDSRAENMRYYMTIQDDLVELQ